ncbi:phosphoribosylglycinamide formyltransferase [Paenibacillus sp. CGMCC 1.16610]|uniref:Phosphoribosylglycinamide formyltransferase n=1 Tax=Paenibacillus anseongense TaxID=2682845 RepID=A0ABW9U0Z9_9BACL|nr:MULTISPECIES: phosphoribosylglycinamide formyltransferase [Paenibacillus]MBA2943610.1 phosphoribosylglycinamide formyltransferase [Paenibacillus sp. CGMCC 1.16610]MVQ33106.1 phosphoribosylglycinamide formyltransferase [Paenibacillus anseongense]
MQPYRIAIFASGSGSNFQAIVDQVQKGKLDVSIELLVCDRPQAYVVERAKEAKVPVFAFRPKEYANREAYEALILKELQDRQVDLVVMAGYMRIITNVLVEPFFGRMINIHPSLLPSFPGVRAIEQAVEYGVKQTGVTVHFVDGGLDSGPIIAQRAVEIHEHETAESLAERIHAAEHVLLPQVIRWLREGRVIMDGRRVGIRL